MRAGDAVQLPRQDAADGGLLLIRPILEHVDVMPRQPDAQLRAPNRKVTALVFVFDRTDLASILPSELRFSRASTVFAP